MKLKQNSFETVLFLFHFAVLTVFEAHWNRYIGYTGRLTDTVQFRPGFNDGVIKYREWDSGLFLYTLKYICQYMH